MNETIFKQRTKAFALNVIQLVEKLPKNKSADIIGKQLLRSATSVGANYRAACRGKSVADIIAKLAIVEEEADESIYWMELLAESGIVSKQHLQNIITEADELTAMTVSSIKTLRKRNPKSKTCGERNRTT
ncbi:MAG: four helix bundle protein [Planctomycetota bacterium]